MCINAQVQDLSMANILKQSESEKSQKVPCGLTGG